jgi:hypothetical protein
LADSTENDDFEFALNNAGQFLAEFARNLGHFSTFEVTHAITELLIMAVPDIVAKIREDPNVPEDIRAKTDEEVVDWFVELLTSRRMYQGQGGPST